MFICNWFGKDIQFITMLKIVEELQKEVFGFCPKSEKDLDLVWINDTIPSLLLLMK